MAGPVRWAVDWAAIGAISCGLAPVPVSVVYGGSLAWYELLAAAIGGWTGAGVGLALHTGLGWVPDRSRVAVALFGLPVPLGTWGGAVAGFAGSFVDDRVVLAATATGAIAAMLQTAWLAPAYVLAERRDAQLAPVMCAAITAPIAGGIAAVVVLVGLQVM